MLWLLASGSSIKSANVGEPSSTFHCLLCDLRAGVSVQLKTNESLARGQPLVDKLQIKDYILLHCDLFVLLILAQ